LFVCLFVGIKPKKLHFASCVEREVNPLAVITHGQRHKAGNLQVRGSYKFSGPKKGKKLTKNLYHKKITQLISRHLVRKTGYQAGTAIVRLLSKANDTGFSRHIKTDCDLPVCITSENETIRW